MPGKSSKSSRLTSFSAKFSRASTQTSNSGKSAATSDGRRNHNIFLSLHASHSKDTQHHAGVTADHNDNKDKFHVGSPRTAEPLEWRKNRIQPRLPDIREHEAKHDAEDGGDGWNTVRNRKQQIAPSTPVGPTRTIPTAYTNQNWRTNRVTPEERKLKWAEERTIGLSAEQLQARRSNASRGQARTAKSYGTMKTFGGRPRTAGGILHVDQTVGVVCWHYNWRSWSSTTKPVPSGWELVRKKDGSLWLRKGRYWIIVDANDEGDIGEIGIYTNGDTGLANVRKEDYSKYFPICPKDVDPKTIYSKTGNAALKVEWLGTTDENRQIKFDRKTMNANWTEVKYRSINEEPLRIIGKISEHSMKPLMKKVLPS